MVCDGCLDDPVAAARFYARWNAAVREYVPADRLLEFNVKQGWAPLCDFLGVPVPAGEFPRVNDAASMHRIIRAGNAFLVAFGALLSVALAYGVAFMLQKKS